MSLDTTLEVPAFLQNAETMDLSERLKKDIHGQAYSWIDRDFKKNIASLVKAKGLNRDKALTGLSAYFTQAMNVLIEDGVAVKWHDKMAALLVGQDRNSVINCLGEKMRTQIESQLLGPISTLTFMDFLRKADKKLVSGQNISEFIADDDTDVRSKVDMTLRFGDRDGAGREIIRLVQLKSIAENNVLMARIDKDHIKSDYFGVVKGQDAGKIISKAHQIQRTEDNKNVFSFVVLVPQFRQSCISNVFGLVQPVRRDLIEIFKTEGTKIGLLPKKA